MITLHCNSCPSTGKNPWNGSTCSVCNGMGKFEVEALPLGRDQNHLIQKIGDYTLILTLNEDHRVIRAIWEK